MSEGTKEKQPLLKRNASYGSTFGALLNLIKSMMGAGLLSIPHAFTKSGLLLGLITFTLIAVVCTYSMLLIIKCKNIAKSKDNSIVSFGDIGRFVFGKTGENLIHFSILTLELAFAAGFIIVIISNLQTLLPHYFNKWFIALCLLPVLILLSWIPWLKDLWIVSLLGSLVYVFGVVMATFYFGIKVKLSQVAGINIKEINAPSHIILTKWSTLPLFAGTAMYSLEGINLVLPIESSMKNPGQAYVVTTLGVSIYFVLVSSYGAFGYSIGYGNCDIVTDCLPPSTINTIIKIALSISLALTHPIILHPASEILENWILSKQSKYFRFKSCVIRSIEVTLTIAIGLLLPNFPIFSDLVGSIVLTSIGFIIPPLLFIRLKKGELNPLVIILNGGIIFLGFGFMVIGTYSSVSEIIKTIKN